MKLHPDVTSKVSINIFKTLEKRFNKIHNEKYDYSETVYSGSKKKMTIVCPVHGHFNQIAGDHLQGKGCMKCGHEQTGMKSRLDGNNACKNAKNVHGGRYDYSLVDYVNTEEKVKIICREKLHGIFMQSMHAHIGQKQDCPICGVAKLIRLNTENDSFQVYYIKIGNVYKIGVTSKRLKTRMSGERFNYRKIFVSDRMTLKQATTIEQRIVKKFKRWKSCKNIMRGKWANSELFNIDILRDPEKTINRMINYLS